MTQLNNARKCYVNKKLAEKSLYHYIKQSWSYIDPSQFRDNWHIKFLSDHLQAFFADQLNYDLMLINIPPGFGKSLLTSVFLPSWSWISNPSERWLTGSKTEELAIRDSRRARDLLTSEWFQQQWGHTWQFKGDENRKRGYENNRHGYRNIFSMTGNVMGKRADNRIIDDPNDASETYNPNKLQATNNWYAGVFSTRDNPWLRTKTVIIQQRIAPMDFSNYILDNLDKKVLHICLPMEFELDRRCITPIGTDPRKKEGEFLSSIIAPEFIEEKKLLLGNRYTGQYQQRPIPLEGSIFKSTDFHYYKKYELPDKFDKIIDSTDIAQKTEKSNDYSVITVWGILGNKKYLIDLWRGRVEYRKLKLIYETMGEKWKPNIRLVEDKSSGTPLFQELKSSSNYPMLAINPKGSKEARADAVVPEFLVGNVLFPDNAPWLAAYVEEMLLFPSNKNNQKDDQVDATTQLLNYLRENNRQPRVTRVT